MNTQNIRFHALFQSVSLSPPSLSSEVSLLWFLTSLLSFHIIISDPPIRCIGYTTLYAPSVMSGETSYHAMLIPFTKKSHQASWFFQWGSKHGPLPRTTHPATALGGLWTVCSPLTSVDASSFHAYRTVGGFLSGYKSPLTHPTPASPIFSGAPLAFCSTPLPTNPWFSLVIQPLG